MANKIRALKLTAKQLETAIAVRAQARVPEGSGLGVSIGVTLFSDSVRLTVYTGEPRASHVRRERFHVWSHYVQSMLRAARIESDYAEMS